MKTKRNYILILSFFAAAVVTNACIPHTGGSASGLFNVATSNATPISTEQAQAVMQEYCSDGGLAMAQSINNVAFQAGYTQDFDNVGGSFNVAMNSAGNLLRSGQYQEYSRSSQLMLPPGENFDYATMVTGTCKTITDTLAGKGYPRSEAIQTTVSGSLASKQANLGQCVGVEAANPATGVETTLLMCEGGIMGQSETSGGGIGNKAAFIIHRI